MKTGVVAIIGLLTLSVTSFAWAQNKKPGRVITLNEITIVGRVQKPIAALDVARIRPTITLSELRKPFTDRIEEAIYKDPF